MDHIAILSKKRKILSKILLGEKTIESRWYMMRKTPYEKISKGDRIYFKESGEPVSATAKVNKVLFFELNKTIIRTILHKYGDKICISKSVSDYDGKKYCTLMFISDVKKIKPFSINKTGYGIMAAWITVKNIDSLRK